MLSSHNVTDAYQTKRCMDTSLIKMATSLKSLYTINYTDLYLKPFAFWGDIAGHLGF